MGRLNYALSKNTLMYGGYNQMKYLNLLFVIVMLFVSSGIISCSSQEYTTAKLAIQQSDFKKAEEYIPNRFEPFEPF